MLSDPAECPLPVSFAAKKGNGRPQVPDTSQTIRWPDTALPVIGMVDNKSIALSPAGSYRVLAGWRVREESRRKLLCPPWGCRLESLSGRQACPKGNSDGRWRGESLAKSSQSRDLVRHERWQGLPPPKAVPPCLIRPLGLLLSPRFARGFTRMATRMADPSDRPTLKGDVEALPSSIICCLRKKSGRLSR